MLKKSITLYYLLFHFICIAQVTNDKEVDSLLIEIYKIKFSIIPGDMDIESFKPVFNLLKVYDNIKDEHQLAKVNVALGYFYKSSFEYETAISYFDKALDNYHNTQQWKSFADTSKQLAMLYGYKKQPNQAEEVLLKSLEISKQHDLDFYVLKPLQEITIFYSYHTDNPEKAISYGLQFQEELEKYKSQNIDNKDFEYTKTIDAAIVNLEMGNSYLKLKQYDNAKAQLDASLNFFLPTGDQEKLARIYKHLFSWALQTKQDNSVIINYLDQFYYYNADYYRDYITSVRGRVNNIEQINNYIEKLEAEQQNFLKERKLRNNITILLILTILLSFVTIVILRKLYLTQKKYNRKLNDEKEVLLSIDKERKLYFSIISHELVPLCLLFQA